MIRLVRSAGNPETNGDPKVSFVIPAKDEADYIGETLSSIAAVATTVDYDVLVVDAGSCDGTADIAREHDATVVEGAWTTIAEGRNLGAERADGEWLAFVDADTTVRPAYLTELLDFVAERNLVAASSRCRITGPARAKLMEATINHVFPRLGRPILPGFNFFIRRDVFEEAGGFPDVPNEDTAFSRRLAREMSTGYCPAVLVESSAIGSPRVDSPERSDTTRLATWDGFERGGTETRERSCRVPDRGSSVSVARSAG